MILMFPINPQHTASVSTESALMHFPLSLSCARISIQDTYTRLYAPTPVVMNINLNCNMKILHDLLLDFRKNIPHITSRFHR
jgi:hypothetical protein